MATDPTTMSFLMKSNVVLYHTPTGSVYKTLDTESGNMHALEVIDSRIVNSLTNHLKAAQDAIQISKHIVNDFENIHRHVMIYTSFTTQPDMHHKHQQHQHQNIKVTENHPVDNEPPIMSISCEYISGNSLQNLILSISDDAVLSMHVVQSYTW